MADNPTLLDFYNRHRHSSQSTKIYRSKQRQCDYHQQNKKLVTLIETEGTKMKCNKCGTINPENAKFCAGCGNPLIATNTQTPDNQKTPQYDNIGGWLILLGIVLVFIPLRILVAISESAKLLDDTTLAETFPKLTQAMQNSIYVNFLLIVFSFYLLYL